MYWGAVKGLVIKEPRQMRKDWGGEKKERKYYHTRSYQKEK